MRELIVIGVISFVITMSVIVAYAAQFDVIMNRVYDTNLRALRVVGV